MAGRFERLQTDSAELNRLAVLERRECVFRFRGGAQIDRRPGPVAQFEVSGDEIGVEVRQEDVADLQAVLGGKRQILIDVALRVDHCRGLRLFVADEI
jgi:hypothetical protein